MQSRLLRFNLQTFAEVAAPGEVAAVIDPAQPATPADDPAAPPTTYTQEQLDTMKVTWEKDWQAKVEGVKATAKQEGLSEAERLAKMTESERLQEQLKQAQAENAQYKSQEARTKLEAEAAKALADEKLPAGFAKMVMSDSAEGIKANITALKETFNASVQSELENRLKSNTPAAGGTGKETDDIQAQVKAIIERGR